MKNLAIAVVALFAVAATGRADCAGDKMNPLAVNVTPSGVEVTGATPRGRIVLVGYGRVWNAEHFSSEFKRFRAYLPADEQGSLVTSRSDAADFVWGAVDVASGRCGSADAPSRGRRQKQIAPDAVKANKGRRDKIELKLPLAYMVVVRPRVGAWELIAGDGGAFDEDQTQDGRTAMSLEALRSIGSTAAAPQELTEGDLVLVFSPHEISMSFMRVAK